MDFYHFLTIFDDFAPLGLGSSLIWVPPGPGPSFIWVPPGPGPPWATLGHPGPPLAQDPHLVFPGPWVPEFSISWSQKNKKDQKARVRERVGWGWGGWGWGQVQILSETKSFAHPHPPSRHISNRSKVQIWTKNSTYYPFSPPAEFTKKSQKSKLPFWIFRKGPKLDQKFDVLPLLATS